MDNIDVSVLNDIFQSLILLFISAGKLKKPKN